MEIALTKQINIEISPLIVRANSLRRLLPQVTTNQTYKTFARNLKKRKKRIFMKIVVVTTKHWTSPLIMFQCYFIITYIITIVVLLFLFILLVYIFSYIQVNKKLTKQPFYHFQFVACSASKGSYLFNHLEPPT